MMVMATSVISNACLCSERIVTTTCSRPQSVTGGRSKLKDRNSPHVASRRQQRRHARYLLAQSFGWTRKLSKGHQDTMSSLSHFFSVVHSMIAHAFETPAFPYMHQDQAHAIEMAELSQHCPFPNSHHHCCRLVVNSSSCNGSQALDCCSSPHEPLLHSCDGSADYPSTAHSSTYLCTFCWRPQRAAMTPSRVVGRRSRLACELCYNSLLDLAIC